MTLLSAQCFITVVRLSESGASALHVTAVGAVWALCHSSFSAVAGRIVNGKRASYLISMACLFLIISAIGFVIFSSVYMQFIWAAMTGVGSAFFFCPFQIFMKYAENGKHNGIVRSTALYVLSWSSGVASGPFIAAFIWGEISPLNGWKYCHIINAVLALIVGICIWPLSIYCHKHNQKDSSKRQSAPKVNYEKMPDWAWLGWIIGVGGCIAVSMIRTLFPYKANLLAINKIDQGIIIALVSYFQALTSLCFIKSRYWMYRSKPVVLFTLCGILSLICFWLGQTPWCFFLGAALFGIFSGCTFFLLVFHSLVHPELAPKYVARNEIIVGVTGIIAPLAGGYIADYSTPGVPFAIAALILFSIILVHIKSAQKIKDIIPASK
ncbi:MAG: MFS transporter [Lentisphaerae bacterium]|nr:MFS transporter [Lentisphaerota bacterium]MCP4103170.1 MFS transporter [Lentisphaerota bacterium]